MHRSKFVLSLVLVLAMVFGFATVGNVRAQSVLTVAFTQEPDTLNMFYSTMSFAGWVKDLVYASLYQFTDTLEAQPVLIEEVPSVENGGISEDYMTYTVKLKPDLKWSDGEALNADDVVFTFEMIMDENNAFLQATQVRETLVSVEKVDDLTVKLVWNSPAVYPENKLSTLNYGFIMPEHVFGPIYEAEGTIQNAEPNQNPTVFSGAYIMSEWRRGELMTFVPNPNYANGVASVEQIVIRFFPDTESAYAAMAAGQVDVLPNLIESDLPRVQALSPDIGVVGVFGGFMESLWLNVRPPDNGTGHPALKELPVRQALRMCIDRRALVRDLLNDSRPVTDSLYSGNKYENPDLGFVEYNPEEGNRLLEEAGWVMGPNGVRQKEIDGQMVELALRHTTTTAQWRMDIQAVVQQQVANCGIRTIITNVPATEYFGSFADGGTLNVGDFDIGQFAQSTALTNPLNLSIGENLACNNIPSTENPGGTNQSGYCDPEIDENYATSATSLDEDEIRAATYRIQELFRDGIPAIVLFPRGDNYAYNSSRFVEPPLFGAGDGGMWFDVVNWQLK
ncbi:MAG: peptide ABC transporter substrate-binding protein [Anaerolineae bacterium]|nr:peptide ABC transporter substrate-binding protein [Anaerolineae bacterium]